MRAHAREGAAADEDQFIQRKDVPSVLVGSLLGTFDELARNNPTDFVRPRTNGRKTRDLVEAALLDLDFRKNWKDALAVLEKQGRPSWMKKRLSIHTLINPSNLDSILTGEWWDDQDRSNTPEQLLADYRTCPDCGIEYGGRRCPLCRKEGKA